MVEPVLWLMKTSIWYLVGGECNEKMGQRFPFIYGGFHEKIIIKVIHLTKRNKLIVSSEEPGNKTEGGYLPDDVRGSCATFEQTPR